MVVHDVFFQQEWKYTKFSSSSIQSISYALITSSSSVRCTELYRTVLWKASFYLPPSAQHLCQLNENTIINISLYMKLFPLNSAYHGISKLTTMFTRRRENWIFSSAFFHFLNFASVLPYRRKEKMIFIPIAWWLTVDGWLILSAAGEQEEEKI